MKTIIINLLMAIALFSVGTETAYSQGCFEIFNNTGCDVDYVIYGNNINCNGTSVVVDVGTVDAGQTNYINSTYCQSFSLMMERIEIYENNTLIATFGNSGTCGYSDTDSWNCSSCSCTLTFLGDWEVSNTNTVTIDN